MAMPLILQILCTTTILGLLEGPWHRVHRPGGHYVAASPTCTFNHIGNCFFAVMSCQFFILAVNACRKWSEHPVIFF